MTTTTPVEIDLDRRQVFAAALNLGDPPTRQAAMTDTDWAGVRTNRHDRVLAYAKLLVEHTRADPARLAAMATAAQRQLDQLPSSETRARAIWARGVQLAEAGLQLVRDAGAEHDPDRQVDLVASLAAEWYPDPGPYRQGLWHRHSWPRKLLRRLSPRWWWRRLTARLLATVAHSRAPVPASFEDITVHLGGRQVGYLSYQVCHPCRRVLLAKMSIDVDHQGRGLGHRALRQARQQAPGYTWHTTAQYDTARSFWRRAGLTDAIDAPDHDDATACPHMNDALHPPSNRRPTGDSDLDL